jgi:hypothetical protein
LVVTGSSLTPDEIRAAAEIHRELGPEYEHAVIDSFLERVGKEIDARVDARLAAPRPAPPPAAQGKPQGGLALALGSIALGIPLTAIAGAGAHTGISGILVVWLAIAIINVAYALRGRPPGSHG